MSASTNFSIKQGIASRLDPKDQSRLERLLQLRMKLRARESPLTYAQLVMPGLEIATHHRVIADKLQATARGQNSRLMIFCPPRHGKSTWATELFPSWYLGMYPDRYIITATYGQELADDFGRRVRNLVTDPVHRAIFPNCRLADDSSSIRCFNTRAGGAYFAVGRGGAITGRGAHLLIIDDPLKDREEAQSATVRHALHEWYASVAYTRLQPRATVIIIQTRWHENDLAGWLLQEHSEEGWDVISLPAIAEADESFRRAGEALWPEKYPLQELERIRTAVGGAVWAALYQQRPAAAEGSVFKRDWWQFYPGLPQSVERVVQSWDTAFKSGAENDYSVCTTWGVFEHGYFLLSLWKGRPEFPELKRMMVALAEEWKPHVVLIEDKASGQSAVQELQRNTVLPVLPVKVDSDKISRAQAVTPIVEAGRVFLPESASWLKDYIDELSCFPTGLHDDAVDSTSQALNYLREQATVKVYPGIILPGLTEFVGADREDLWLKAAEGWPMSEAEIDLM